MGGNPDRSHLEPLVPNWDRFRSIWTNSLQKSSLLNMISKRDAKQEITCGLRKPVGTGARQGAVRELRSGRAVALRCRRPPADREPGGMRLLGQIRELPPHRPGGAARHRRRAQRRNLYRCRHSPIRSRPRPSGDWSNATTHHVRRASVAYSAADKEFRGGPPL
jgi:hypothetical protein